MLFNSYQFLFLFLPLCLIGFYLVYSPKNGRWIHWINLCSIIFYGYWSVYYLCVLSVSVCFNYLIAREIAKKNKALLIFGVAVNLLVLGYFKYFNFFIEITNMTAGANLRIAEIILPLGISFFTFQKIAFLVDSYQQKAKSVSFSKYLFFVTFFPQLIAGPIVHHSEIFAQLNKRRDHFQNFAIGFSVFAIGLFKKVIIADGLAPTANAVFNFAELGGHPGFFESWVGTLAYMLQIYFDFSAYSDMALGLAKLFGVVLPQNFASPYTALSLAEFWRRWHISLSRFLRDYLYIPLGGNRQGDVRTKINLMITMLLGGLWHGANFNFILWGGLHGLFLIINQAFAKLNKRGLFPVMPKSVSWILTMLCVALAWIPFRASNAAGAINMWRGAMMLSDAKLSADQLPRINITDGLMTIVLLAACVILPNTCEIFRKYDIALPSSGYPKTFKESRFIQWRPSALWAALCVFILWIAFLKLNEPSAFLYFQF